jgi:hypothetical protein
VRVFSSCKGSQLDFYILFVTLMRIWKVEYKGTFCDWVWVAIHHGLLWPILYFLSMLTLGVGIYYGNAINISFHGLANVFGRFILQHGSQPTFASHYSLSPSNMESVILHYNLSLLSQGTWNSSWHHVAYSAFSFYACHAY